MGKLNEELVNTGVMLADEGFARAPNYGRNPDQNTRVASALK